MSIYFDNEGMRAERICANQFKGRLTKEKEDQFRDIDLYIKSFKGEWKSVSVKDQLRGTSKGFTSVQVELYQEDTDTGEWINGCFHTNESDYYMWRVCYQGVDSWAVIPSESLKEFINTNLQNLRDWTTTRAVEAKNRSYGRKYNRAGGVELEMEDMAELGRMIPVVKGEGNEVYTH